MAARPEKPDGYALEFPKDFKTEIPLKFDDKDPRVAALREFGHKRNWTQDDFSEALTLEAHRVVAETKAIKTAQEAENKKLGANGTARVTAATTFLAGLVGKEGAAQIMDRLALASDVELVEKIQAAFSNQGGGAYSGSGRVPAPADTNKIPGYEKMTFEQRRHAQDRARAGAAR